MIPAGNNTVQIFTDNSIIRTLDDGGQSDLGYFCLFALGDILESQENHVPGITFSR